MSPELDIAIRYTLGIWAEVGFLLAAYLGVRIAGGK